MHYYGRVTHNMKMYGAVVNKGVKFSYLWPLQLDCITYIIIDIHVLMKSL